MSVAAAVVSTAMMTRWREGTRTRTDLEPDALDGPRKASDSPFGWVNGRYIRRERWWVHDRLLMLTYDITLLTLIH